MLSLLTEAIAKLVYEIVVEIFKDDFDAPTEDEIRAIVKSKLLKEAELEEEFEKVLKEGK
jgi:hypothetical protein